MLKAVRLPLSILSRLVRENNGTINTGKLRQETFLLQVQIAAERVLTASVLATGQSQQSLKFSGGRFTWPLGYLAVLLTFCLAIWRFIY